MSRSLVALTVLGLLLAVSIACADVTITSPVAGSTVGPATVVTGMASQRAFLVVYSEVMNGSEVIGTVPGLRHWTNEDNSYNVKISTPRLFLREGQDAGALGYIIHVRAYSQAPKRATDVPDLGEATVSVLSE